MADLGISPTPLSLDQMGQILCGTYTELYGQPPSRDLGEVSLALLAVENDAGRAIVHHNWGNLAAYSGWTGDTWSTKTHTFQVQPDHRSGAKAWWRQMHRRYKNFLQHAYQGHWKEAARSIVEDGYCPEPDCTFSLYQRALESWRTMARRAMATCQFSPIPTSLAGFAPTDRVVGPVSLVLGVLTLGYFEAIKRGLV